MRFPADFLDEIRARVPCSQVAGRRVKLKRAGREWQGLSPFNREKTPSFFVNDQKGRWFDFSAGKSGDAFSFLIEAEGLTFAEAVERLAGEAGLELPTVTPESRKVEARRLSLIQILDVIAAFYRSQLAAHPEAVAYLAARGIDHRTADAFGIGFSPADSAGLKTHLAAEGISLEDAAEAGVIVAGADVPVAYDRFRGRVIIPIRDARGRVVSFGGRAIEDDRKPKYLNGPETPIFEKGRILFNGDRAREPAHEGASVIVVEGYTDVMSAERAGFPAAVATMGTAVTDQHLLALWRLSEMPIFCLDGDSAGRRAMRKVIEIALPMLIPGRSLRFVVLPPGDDPDTVVRHSGAAAFQRAVEGQITMADMLWRLWTEGKVLSDIDTRAKVEAEISAVVETIPTKVIRSKYLEDMRRRLNAVTRQRPIVRSNGHSNHSTSPGAIRLVEGPVQRRGAFSLREALFLAAMVSSPALASESAEEIAADPTLSEHSKAVLAEILNLIASIPEVESGGLIAELSQQGRSAYDQVMEICHRNGIRSLDPGGDGKAAADILRKH